LIVVFNSQSTITIRFLNFLFIVAVLGSIVSYHTGTNPFGYIPDFGDIGNFASGSVGWRISLFPLVTESSFFALVVIVANYYLNPSASRYFYYGLGLYFLAFSGSRTSLIIFLFFIAFVLINRLFHFHTRPLYIWLSPLMITLFIFLLSFKSLLLLVKDTRIGFLNEFIFRSEKGLSEKTSVQDVATRTWIWSQHFKIYAKNPVFGVGTFDFNDYKDDTTKAYQQSTGSESFLTGLLARVGLAALLIVFLIFIIQSEAMRNENSLKYVLSFYIFITMISYGSFMVAYNFMFLIIFGLLNTREQVRS
jgi:hypothetical protein